jgi:hypothetical protein
MTYMSIAQLILTLESLEHLFRLEAPRGKRAVRGLWLTATALRAFEEGIVPLLGAKGQTRALFERWVTGGHVTLRMSGSKPGADLALLDPPPPEVWEFRVVQSSNYIRAFCRFLEQDAIVVTNIHSRNMLGNPGSEGWKNAMSTCVEQWEGHFPLKPPHTGSDPGDYVANHYSVIK